MRVLAGVRDTGDSDDPSGSPPVFQVFCQKASTQARLIKASGIESVNTSAFTGTYLWNFLQADFWLVSPDSHPLVARLPGN
jgi:hypothetical protein